VNDSLREIAAIEPAQSGPSLPCARLSRSTLNSRVFCSPQQRQIGCSRSRPGSFSASELPVPKRRLFVWPLHFEGPSENSAATNFGLRRRSRRGFGLRRRWRPRRRQILALHRINQLAISGAPDRRTIVDARGHVLWRRLGLRPRRRRNQENGKDELLHRLLGEAWRCSSPLNRIGHEKSNGSTP